MEFAVSCYYDMIPLVGVFEQIELPAKLIDYFKRSNKGNINHS